MENNLKYLVALSHFPKFGPARLKRLKNYFSDFNTAFTAGLEELMRAGIEENVANEFVGARANLNPDAIMAEIEKEGIEILTIDAPDYPRLLKEIFDPPQLLFYRGLIKPDECSLAIVGTRKVTSYGQRVASDISADLARNGITIVSGLALGVDAIAHTSTLQNNGRTIAVLGTGLDRQSIYPTPNRYLADKIISQGGAVLTEFPLHTLPLKFNFPQRNRIISGLSHGTLVVEAAEKSGALITARCALEQNREVFAVPGNIYSEVSIGPNNLIKQGAKAVVSAAEIIEALDLMNISHYIETKKILPETREEETILNVLGAEPMHIDEIIRTAQMNPAEINAILSIMEMKGMVKNLGGMMYVSK